MIELSPEIINSINFSVSSAFNELIPIFVVLISIILSFFALRKIIFLITLTKR